MSQAAQQQTDRRASNTQYYLRALHQMIDIGVDLTRLVQREAKLQTQFPHPVSDLFLESIVAKTPDPTIAYERITRAVRRTILLAVKLNDAADPSIAPQPEPRTAARKPIIRAIEDAIADGIEANEQAEHPQAESHDRLDSPERDPDVADADSEGDDITSRSIAEIIREVCCDLGIFVPPGNYPWKHLALADIAALAARAAMAPPSEFPPHSAELVNAMQRYEPIADGKTTDPPT
jgi:hypothetical protein